eukprot:221955-Prymnesium_polylepis.1
MAHILLQAIEQVGLVGALEKSGLAQLEQPESNTVQHLTGRPRARTHDRGVGCRMSAKQHKVMSRADQQCVGEEERGRANGGQRQRASEDGK